MPPTTESILLPTRLQNHPDVGVVGMDGATVIGESEICAAPSASSPRNVRSECPIGLQCSCTTALIHASSFSVRSSTLRPVQLPMVSLGTEP